MTLNENECRELARRVHILTLQSTAMSTALREVERMLDSNIPIFPEEPTYPPPNLERITSVVSNGDFSSSNWTDITMPGGQSRGQQPDGWGLEWLIPGQTIPGTATTITVEPECVHKLSNQLPPNEQKGGVDALILEGDAVYKVFSAAGIFYAELSQTILVSPGHGEISASVQVHKSSPDPWSAEAGLWANDVGSWYNGASDQQLKDHEWLKMSALYNKPAGGTVEIKIRVKSKWELPVDFFIDAVKIEIF